MSMRSGSAGIVVIGGIMVLAGCSGGSSQARADGVGATRSAPATPTTATPAPTSPTPTPTPLVRRTLKPGARNADVRALQQRLKELKYDPGKIDGKYGPTLQRAVWAFQKVNSLKVSGTVDKRFWAALDAPKAPRPVSAKRERTRVDVDLRRQYLVVYQAGQVALISTISSGNGEYYCARDFGATKPRCRYAGTPTGDFRTGRRASGWETSPLGQLYNPIYFNGGIAFHGSLTVPSYPDSHGCVRLPMHVAEVFPRLVGTNVPVHVRRPS
ncbi:murein L,D-transpeptidase [Actinomadura craniellae]|uniref:Murein L,D-transpeptidase n=1 Tax=Actinomadura craniellae TaxID=2231787 RepID=A0A365H209_9ACTN|nr:L,D-transpeptidase family protein [Actinomadura craniellae]RAY13079.1 murein L,D-transpeptidase [Actinomadura craniellae]